jgi:integration host factor subunit alpha
MPVSGKTVTRVQLSQALRKKVALSRKESLWSIEAVLNEISAVLKENKSIKIPLFGVFFSREKKERMGRNPKTLKGALISARKVPGFRVSRLMKDRVDLSLKKKKPSTPNHLVF